MQNAETINRLVKQGEFLLKTFHAEYEKDPAGHETEFLRGELAGWRDTLHKATGLLPGWADSH
jgi:hypothetical protein